MKNLSLKRAESTTTLTPIMRHIGLDVHKDSISVGLAEADPQSPPKFLKTISSDLHAVEKLVSELRDGGRYELRVCYEAGPTGFTLARRLQAWGIEVMVVSPTHIPKGSGERIKTDRHDALKLARLLRAGELKGIHIPDARDEAVRDLCRARTDAVEDLRRLRQQLKSFLLRQGYHYKGKSSWTQAHQRYLRELVMDHPAQKQVLEQTLMAIDLATSRIAGLEAALADVVADWHRRPVVEALQCLRGVGWISAVVFTSELGDLGRFTDPRQLMAYLGLVTHVFSTGNSQKQGSITKCGNRHARVFLIEAAQHYRKPPKVSKELSRRQEGKSRALRAISWQAQQRLHRKTWRLLNRMVPAPKVMVAVARELAGFLWAIHQECLKPGSVYIRSHRPDPSPTQSARAVEYVLRRCPATV